MTNSSVNHLHLRQAQRAIWADSRLSSQEKHVGVYMINRMRDDFTGAFPYIETICSDLGLHRATAIRALNRLVEIGWFDRRPMGRKRTYSINDMELLVSMAAKHRETETVARHRSHTATGRTQRQVAHSDSTSRTKRLVAGGTSRTQRHRSAQEFIGPYIDPGGGRTRRPEHLLRWRESFGQGAV